MDHLETLCGLSIGSTNDEIAAEDGRGISKIISNRKPKENMYPSSEILYHTKRAAKFLKRTRFLRRKRTSAALFEIEQVQKIVGDNPNLKNSYYVGNLIAWSEASYNLKDYGHAREFLSEALEIDPNNIRALILDGKANRIRCDYSRADHSLLNRTIQKWLGIEKTEKIEPDYDRAIQSLERAKTILESENPVYGVTKSEKEKYARDIYLNLGGSYRSAIEENALPGGDILGFLEKAAENYHKAFLTEPKATDKEALHIHTSLVFLYTEIKRLKGKQAEGETGGIDDNIKELYEHGVQKANEFGWDAKIEASNKLKEAYRRNNKYLDPLASLAELHAGLAKHLTKQ